VFPSHCSQPLAAANLHVWYTSLEVAPQELVHIRSLLSADEMARAERFYFERDRDRFIIGRGILRSFLGYYLGRGASEVKIVYGPHGKPAVESVSPNQTLQFSLAHSNDQIIFIFGWNRPVGIDLEHIHPLQNVDRFAEQFYSVRETALINSLSGSRKWDAFYKIWTCKEAYLKANGSGLSVPLDQVEIFLGHDETAKMISIGKISEQANGWNLSLLKPLPGYQAAIAIQGKVEQAQLRKVSPVWYHEYSIKKMEGTSQVCSRIHIMIQKGGENHVVLRPPFVARI